MVDLTEVKWLVDVRFGVRVQVLRTSKNACKTASLPSLGVASCYP